nr:MAG TPA: hypothetical protein [Caudoviricetes sp.]DAO06678.1 MAG TPA: hypothetical protein [Caudoviricetes sp.]
MYRFVLREMFHEAVFVHLQSNTVLRWNFNAQRG